MGSEKVKEDFSMKEEKQKDNVKKALFDFGNETTIHGLVYVVNKENILYRLIWLGICTTFFVVFLIQGNDIFQHFLTWPYSTKIDIVGRPSLAFPAVTVCNANMMRRSKLPDTRFAGLIDLDGGTAGSDYDYSWFFSSGFLNNHFSSLPGYGPSSSGGNYYPSSSSGRSGGISSSSAGSDGLSSSSAGSDGLSSSSAGSDGTSSSSAGSDGLSSSSSGSDGLSSSSAGNNGQLSSSAGSDGLSSSSAGSDGLSSSSAGSGGLSSSSAGSNGLSSSSAGSDGLSSSSAGSDGLSSSSAGSDGLSSSASSSGFSSQSSSSSRPWGSSSNPHWRDSSSNPSWRDFAQWSWYNPSEFDDFQFLDYNWDQVTDSNDWSGFYEASTADDFSDFVDVVKPTRAELAELGHQLKDFIVQCSFDRRPCNITRDFHVWQNRYFGNCFTFNSDLIPDKENIETGKTGGLNGLHLTIFAEQPEYLGILSPGTGAKVSIHHPNEKPFPEDNALDLPTGQETSIGIRQESIKRLGGYYTNCTTNGAETNFTSTEFSYSMSACNKQCYQLHLSQLCECVNDQFFDDYPIKCDVLNTTHQICKQFVAELYLEDKLPCSCPPPCNEFKYIKTPSSMLWPSERYEEHIYKRLNKSADANENILRILQSNELSRKNLIRLKIFYEDLNYEFVEMVPVYTIPSLLGSVGGLMGLYIGMSFISVFEVFFLLLRLLKITFLKVFCRKPVVHPYPVKNI